MRTMLAFALPVILFASVAAAEPHELAIPLHDSKLPIDELVTSLSHELHFPLKISTHQQIDLSGVVGSEFVEAMNAALGDGCRLSLTDDQLVLHVDPAKMPHGCYAAEQSLRVFTALMAPQATARQERTYGLLLPATVDEHKPMVILVRGLDADCCNWDEIARRLENDGYQVARFNYPDHEPIADNDRLLGQHVTALHETFPKMHLDVIGHSLGALMARTWVESDDYSGGVDHLILLAPPNHGSTWTKFRFFLEAQKHYELWKSDPDWRPTWFITEGIGGAARDLQPNSKFLAEANDRPRRDGVKYTIVAGNRHPAWQIGANFIDDTSKWIPQAWSDTWGFRQAEHGLEHAADSLRNHKSNDDGPVTLKSAALPGVDDFVVLPANHLDIYCGADPLAWPIIEERLGK